MRDSKIIQTWLLSMGKPMVWGTHILGIYNIYIYFYLFIYLLIYAYTAMERPERVHTTAGKPLPKHDVRPGTF